MIRKEGESVSYFLLTLTTYSGTLSLPLALHSPFSLHSKLSFVAEASVVQSGGFCYGAKTRAMRGRFKWHFK